MNKKKLLLWGAFLLILLGILCVLTHAKKIENKLTANAQEQLQLANMEGLNVSFDGRTAILSGEAASPEMMEKAEALLRSINGVRTVKTRLKNADLAAVETPEASTVANLTAETTEPSPSAEPVEKTVPIKEKINLDGFRINFETNSCRLSGISASTRNHLHKILTENANLRIKILGHTDSKGSDAYNMTLSLKRAKSVKSALVQKGSQPERILVDGMGERRPIADNSTASGRQKNRRVEFIIAEEK
ncbi:OmpA family protein [bacterium]|nr:OmpA family protein [bacterium]